jgi:hypothetical protein
MTPEQATITPEELEWAFKKFRELELTNIDYTWPRWNRIITVMGKYTNQDPKISAGCETGIKLGLLIAERRNQLKTSPTPTAAPDVL